MCAVTAAPTTPDLPAPLERSQLAELQLLAEQYET